MTKNKYNYKDSGVNIEQGQKFVEDIKNLSSSSSNRYSIGGIGGFSGYVDIPDHINNPVYALACDGVGTKMKIAIQQNNLNTIGIDLVAMCVNDLIVSGAKPIAFLDYYGCSSLDRVKGEQIISGILAGCELAQCDLVGGETAEMPGFYSDGEYDLAGFCVGVVEKAKIIDGSKIAAGDTIIGLPSSGPHSNGYSLIRKVIERQDMIPNDDLLDDLLAPTRIYVKSVRHLLKQVDVHGMVHITGGGFFENIPRVFSDPNHGALLDLDSWQQPEVFSWLQQAGNISNDEMMSTFNCGLGMLLLVAEADVEQTLQTLKEQGEHPVTVGQVVAGDVAVAKGQILVR